MPCTAHVAAVRDRLDDFDDTTEIALITFATAATVAEYKARNSLPFQILIDENRSTYRSYGLGRGSIARVYGWRAWRRYAQIYRATGLDDMQRATDDTLQLGGDFVIAPGGTLTYGFWGKGPDHRPSVDTLVAAAKLSQQ